MQFGRYMKWGLVVLLALLARSELEPAWADENEDFRRHYEQAIGLYDRGKYEESIAAFQKAYALRQLPRLLLNLGQLYRKLGRAREALGYYELYLRVEPNPEPKLKVELDQYIQQTRAMLEAAQRIQTESEIARQQAAQERRLDAASPPMPSGRDERAGNIAPDVPLSAAGVAPAPGNASRAGEQRLTRDVAAASESPGAVAIQPAQPSQRAAPPAPVASGPSEQHSALHKQWWLWTLVGIGVVGIGVGVTAGVLASQGSAPQSPLGTVRVFALQGRF